MRKRQNFRQELLQPSNAFRLFKTTKAHAHRRLHTPININHTSNEPCFAHMVSLCSPISSSSDHLFLKVCVLCVHLPTVTSLWYCKREALLTSQVNAITSAACPRLLSLRLRPAAA
eukprot:2460861-Amphidinium_carterae.1